MLENRAAAMNRADGHAAALFYAQDAVMEERDIQPAWVSRGRREIQVRLQELADSGLRLDLVGSPVQIGRYIGEPTRFYEAGGTGTGEGVLVFELDKKGLIAHQWIMGVTRP